MSSVTTRQHNDQNQQIGRIDTTGILIDQVGKIYPGAPMPAVEDVSIEVPRGEVVCIIGASGCGKSTLLRMVAGFEPISTGNLTVAGAQVTRPSPDRGVVFQDYGLFPWLTVRENVEYGPRQARLPRITVKERAEAAIESVGLSRVAASFPHQLSGGMQQRVAIARILANKPALRI